ncbi:GAF domain-containing protein [Streptacidiphilus jiangxiensis]|uniref:Histidine kinase n=1 Tax=Streptacidiphilus jiangxiensis TaxID=235985 RepID=A0A1H7QV70_STRJI|nr:GAF domain-containing protein [Streptacidiphilus jiangxiensis]SEL51525.1 Histidine kinase [Streptacidiphilus jiangxiensis]
MPEEPSAATDRGALGLPDLRLDQLLEELQSRLDAARGTRDRVHSLLEAVLTVGRELDLDQALQQIVESAVSLVDARYGALGVIGDDGMLAKFLTTGMTPEQVERIGPFPTGHGILGELIRHPEPLRLRDIAEHVASVGFPANHPPMHSFLGVPIRVRGEVFGNLYLTEKRGGGQFDAEDESVLQTLAVAAGVAIDNARLYREARLRERWLTASGEITSRLLSGASEHDVLAELVQASLGLVEADLGVIALALPTAAGAELAVQLAEGVGAEEHRGLLLPLEGTFMGAAFTAQAPVTSNDVANDVRITAGPPRWQGLGAAVAVPMGSGPKGPRGVLMLARRAGLYPFAAADVAPLKSFADQAALALELAARRSDAEQLALLEDHDRIARDLHDLAIQRIFATGMTLQSAQRFITHPQAADRVGRAVEDLDETVKIIRTSIFGLRSRASAQESAGLRARLVDVVSRFIPTFGFTPSLRLEGLLDTDVSAEIAEDVLAVVEEALSNASRHAAAKAVEVSAKVTGGTAPEVVVTVTDNGVGLPEGGRRSGLVNLAERAAKNGGTLETETPAGGGTRLVWRVPVLTEP